jgi:hypothetical protein
MHGFQASHDLKNFLWLLKSSQYTNCCALEILAQMPHMLNESSCLNIFIKTQSIYRIPNNSNPSDIMHNHQLKHDFITSIITS